jgi:hypothetical protein
VKRCSIRDPPDIHDRISIDPIPPVGARSTARLAASRRAKAPAIVLDRA